MFNSLDEDGEDTETTVVKKKKNITDKDNKTNHQKILEKFHIPRILDLQDASNPDNAKFLRHLRRGKLRRLEKEKNWAPSTGKYANQYKLTSSVIIERSPTLIPEPTEYEQERYDKFERLEELIRREPIRMISLMEDLPEFKEDDTANAGGGGGASGGVEEMEEDFSNYKPESRTTQDDINDNRKSLNRKLDKSLYLIIKKAGSRYPWQFPSTNWIQGESIKNTAERALRDSCGEKWKYWIPSQAPCGVYKYRVKEELQDLLKAEGIKEFFFRSHYFGGNLKMNDKIVKDYLWVSKDEMKEYFSKEYYDQVHPLIFDDCFYGHISFQGENRVWSENGGEIEAFLPLH
eukprot:gene8060-9915_t